MLHRQTGPSWLFASIASSLLAAAQTDFTPHANVFQGTINGGNRFPGVVAKPFAMVKLGPDVVLGTADAYSGYLPSGNIFGFSMMHESGTGGAPKYGVVSQMPATSNVSNPLADISQDRSAADQGSVGYYKSQLANGVAVELSATEHAGLYQYTFPSNAAAPSIVVDASHVLNSWRGLGWEQHYSRGNFTIFQDGHYEGSGTYNNGWNLSPDWTISFCGRFSEEPETSRTFKGTGTTLVSYDTTPSVAGNERVGGVFTFTSRNIKSRVGISFISSSKACQNLDNEIKQDTTLETLTDKAKEMWNAEVFSKVQISGASDNDTQLLYSSLLGMFLIPSNRSGENPGWSSSEPYYDDIFTLWDTHRCHTSLFQIVQPTAYEEFIRSLVDVWRHDGFMPDARSSNFNGRVQGGTNADNVLADAYVKGVRGAVNWEDGFAAMQTNAEKVPANNNDTKAPDSSTKEGRGALPDWLQLGWITPTYSRAVSRAIEYSTNDFGLYQVAAGLGKTEEADKYFRRSRYWRNHWDPHASSHNYTGFVVPRLANGTFPFQDPSSCGGCYWGDAYYEDNAWVYSMNAIHDVVRLKELIGGDAQFVDRINKIFDLNYFNVGNEPAFTTPYLYNFVTREQWRSVDRSRQIAKRYSAAANGLPGNSDAGAMESNILLSTTRSEHLKHQGLGSGKAPLTPPQWQMIGLWPVTGQTTFLIVSPWFPSLTFDLGSGKTLKITTTGGTKDTAPYVQSLRVNGKQWDKAWVSWDDIFANGGTMEFVMGETPVNWATGDLPPSPASFNAPKRPLEGALVQGNGASSRYRSGFFVGLLTCLPYAAMFWRHIARAWAW
ncbi:glycosyl hydrolase [Byssothecium circinans]|uniref:Glycosyl hydrolase n=1 Tax=Byssothecium circinans TaxID=147558 RepID=A0A6A5TC97_9PLEO|nr:glycosyl hydrolase [Byssothecium circinans]